MRKLRYQLVDVFTNERFGGNQLAVFTNGRGLETELMQQIAKELNLAETTFVLPPDAKSPELMLGGRIALRTHDATSSGNTMHRDPPHTPSLPRYRSPSSRMSKIQTPLAPPFPLPGASGDIFLLLAILIGIWSLRLAGRSGPRNSGPPSSQLRGRFFTRHAAATPMRCERRGPLCVNR